MHTLEWIAVCLLVGVLWELVSVHHTLRGQLNLLSKDLQDIKEELQWHKNLTFAHELKEWIQQIPWDGGSR
jgi:hypothetical protein